jgi:hypothetical protein
MPHVFIYLYRSIREKGLLCVNAKILSRYIPIYYATEEAGIHNIDFFLKDII